MNEKQNPDGSWSEAEPIKASWELKTRRKKAMKKENNTTVHGIGFCGLLTIALIVLKLIGKISWSWIWVFSPLWISTAFWILFIVFLILVKTGGNNDKRK